MDDVVGPARARSVGWWYFDEGRRFALEAELPAAEGAVVARALERVARTIPAMPDEDGTSGADARRADALVAMCSARIAVDGDPDRATVVIHAQAKGLEEGSGGCEVEDGPVLHPASVRRALCNARTQIVLEDRLGNVIGLGARQARASRVDAPPGVLSRSRVSLPGLWDATIHRGAPRPVVAPRRSNGAREPRPDLLVPPSTRP